MMPRYIDADALIAELNERIEAAIKWGTNAIADRNDEIRIRAEQAVATFCEASLTAKKMPTADVAPVRHGRWGKAEQRGCVTYSGAYAECSICHGEPVFMAHHMAFCPHCGATMDGGDGA